MPKNIAIGIDIGGTSAKVGLVSSGGELIGRTSFATDRLNGKPQQLLKELDAAIADLLRRHKQSFKHVRGIGVGLPGAIDVQRGFIYYLTNLKGWENTFFIKKMEKQFPVPVMMENDANLIGFAEYHYGAAQAASSMLCVTLGTGVGGSFIVNGRVFHGSHFPAIEIGHIILDEKGPVCGCGRRGCIETYIGNRALVRQAKRVIKRYPCALMAVLVKKEGLAVTPPLIARAARQGDRHAQAIWQEAAHRLGIVLGGLVNVLDPEQIVISGGLAHAGNLLMKPLRQSVRAHAMDMVGNKVSLVRGAIKKEPGIIGAAALVFKQN